MSDQTLDEKLKQIDIVISREKNALSSSSVQTADYSWWTTTNAMTISSVVLLFGLVVFCLATYLIRAGRDSDGVLRIFGTIMIVFLAVFLVVAGYTDTQIAPVMGLLGTIAGYLLGRQTSGTRPNPAVETDASQAARRSP